MKRRFPEAPVVAVSGFVLNERNQVLVVQRGKEPQKGLWSLPGGAVRLGETVKAALKREIREECGVEVDVVHIVGAFDRILRNPSGQIEYHYVVLNFLCRLAAGNVRAASDAAAVRWITADEIENFQWTTGVADLLRDIFHLLPIDHHF